MAGYYTCTNMAVKTVQKRAQQKTSNPAAGFFASMPSARKCSDIVKPKRRCVHRVLGLGRCIQKVLSLIRVLQVRRRLRPEWSAAGWELKCQRSGLKLFWFVFFAFFHNTTMHYLWKHYACVGTTRKLARPSSEKANYQMHLRVSSFKDFHSIHLIIIGLQINNSQMSIWLYHSCFCYCVLYRDSFRIDLITNIHDWVFE